MITEAREKYELEVSQELPRVSEAFLIYMEAMCTPLDEDWRVHIEDFEEHYAGHFYSRREFAEDLADQVGLLADVPDHVAMYFDYDSWGRDLMLGDYWESEGHYFREY